MFLDQDTIVAISTPPGRGAIGIVRLSGARACEIAGRLARTRNPLRAGAARLGVLLDEAGHSLDQAIITFYAAPHSYTTEEVVEIACHGAPVLLDHLLRRAIAAGARLAEPGEFTQRAFLSGRLDLTQAEAVHDLISAQTLQQTRVAAAQLGGSLARSLAPIKQSLLRLIAAMEAGIDFAEDDLDLLPDAAIAAQLAAVQSPLQALAGSYSAGRILREGFSLALVGRPNAGKSSLFNRLLGRERAIVTAQAGTTRDSIAEPLSLQGIPVQLIDTAGLRSGVRDMAGGEDAEAQGIARTRATLAEADVVLHVIDATSLPDLHADDVELLQSLEGRAHLVAYNKCDLNPGASHQAIRTSALTGEGIPELEIAIVAVLGLTPAGAETALISNLRQHNAIVESLDAMSRAGAALTQRLPHELLLMDLHAALEALDTLTGATSTEDLLRLIFATFCIGK